MKHGNAELPKELLEALGEDEKAAEIVHRLPPSHRREYVVWVDAAKQEKTRRSRALKAVERLKAATSN